jgi:hypothetical protein
MTVCEERIDARPKTPTSEGVYLRHSLTLKNQRQLWPPLGAVTQNARRNFVFALVERVRLEC